MVVVCQVIPAEELSGDQLQRLAEALGEWCRTESGRRQDVVVEMEGHAVRDLKQGDYPRPLAVRLADASGYELAQVEAFLGERATSRDIEIRVHCDDHDGVAASLREGLSEELVQEIRAGDQPS